MGHALPIPSTYWPFQNMKVALNHATMLTTINTVLILTIMKREIHINKRFTSDLMPNKYLISAKSSPLCFLVIQYWHIHILVKQILQTPHIFILHIFYFIILNYNKLSGTYENPYKFKDWRMEQKYTFITITIISISLLIIINLFKWYVITIFVYFYNKNNKTSS